jgi:hypothetical protein
MNNLMGRLRTVEVSLINFLHPGFQTEEVFKNSGLIWVWTILIQSWIAGFVVLDWFAWILFIHHEP